MLLCRYNQTGSVHVILFPQAASCPLQKGMKISDRVGANLGADKVRPAAYDFGVNASVKKQITDFAQSAQSKSAIALADIDSAGNISSALFLEEIAGSVIAANAPPHSKPPEDLAIFAASAGAWTLPSIVSLTRLERDNLSASLKVIAEAGSLNELKIAVIEKNEVFIATNTTIRRVDLAAGPISSTVAPQGVSAPTTAAALAELGCLLTKNGLEAGANFVSAAYSIDKSAPPMSASTCERL
jgi:hypothetical protein